MMTDVVRQGFICPNCMADMGDLPGLKSHVETSHPEDGAELTDSVIGNVRGFLDKAKRGMKKLDAKMSAELSQVNIGVSTSVADLASMASAVQERVHERTKQPSLIRLHPVKPEIGINRSHSEYFLKHRESSVNESAVRTNMLIIRLDKLINSCPTDITKRKEFERSIVPWSADQESLHCGRCAAKFGITRRRHHCRLCGRVMCHQCSRFLGFLSARKLTNPALAAEMLESLPMSPLFESCPSHSRRLIEITQKTTGKMKSFLEGAVGKIQSDGSEVSLGSLLQQDEAECLRVCGSCLIDLERREDMMEQRNPPVLAEQYETLDRLMNEVASMASSYSRMASSLNNGETMYTLKLAEEMRTKLFQKQQEIDLLSQRMASDTVVCGLKETQLRKNIRSVTVQYLQGIISSVCSLPSCEEYIKLVEKHKKEIALQIEESRRRNEVSLKPSASVPSVSFLRNEQSRQGCISGCERRQTDEGWTPQQTRSYNPFIEEENMVDPMSEQREIIKGFLSQAAAAGRLEEVEMLERNLHDLEKEMEKNGLLS